MSGLFDLAPPKSTAYTGRFRAKPYVSGQATITTSDYIMTENMLNPQFLTITVFFNENNPNVYFISFASLFVDVVVTITNGVPTFFSETKILSFSYQIGEDGSLVISIIFGVLKDRNSALYRPGDGYSIILNSTEGTGSQVLGVNAWRRKKSESKSVPEGTNFIPSEGAGGGFKFIALDIIDITTTLTRINNIFRFTIFKLILYDKCHVG